LNRLDAENIGQRMAQAFTEQLGGEWAVHISTNPHIEPHFISRNGVRATVQQGHRSFKDLPQEFWRVAEGLVPEEERPVIEVAQWWMLFWRCDWCGNVFQNISGDKVKEADVAFMFDPKKPRVAKHECDDTRRGVGRFIGMRPALIDEIPKEAPDGVDELHVR
jgi:hypothetical protein